ncbi:MAG: helix-turn-helix transcriptional regulator [Spirochaetes bacterium]|nr:helix-turn-helix transcriptional regulator [Spirochaetota bacterium]
MNRAGQSAARQGLKSSDEKKLKTALPGEATLATLSEFFKVFGDVTRIKILYLLSRSDLCVHDITSILEMNQSAISHQLRILKQARLVRYRRDGRSICYSLDDDHVKQIFNQGFEHISE